jgi:hypothetical protein
VHQLKAFCYQLHIEDRNACDVAARSIEARDETQLHRVGTDQKNYGDRLGLRLNSQRSWCATPYDDKEALPMQDFPRAAM